jgi:hypothetical protein
MPAQKVCNPCLFGRFHSANKPTQCFVDVFTVRHTGSLEPPASRGRRRSSIADLTGRLLMDDLDDNSMPLGIVAAAQADAPLPGDGTTGLLAAAKTLGAHTATCVLC